MLKQAKNAAKIEKKEKAVKDRGLKRKHVGLSKKGQRKTVPTCSDPLQSRTHQKGRR